MLKVIISCTSRSTDGGFLKAGMMASFWSRKKSINQIDTDVNEHFFTILVELVESNKYLEHQTKSD